MDNKRWYKRISTCFWFILASLPLFVALIGFTCQYFGNINETVNIDLNVESTHFIFSRFGSYFANLLDWFRSITPTFLRQLFMDLFDLIDDEMEYYLANFCAWFVWVYMVELMVDFIVWLPKWFHSILEKGFDKLS